ncbi:SPRC protein, partial [Polyodon spathula]|nr:SPRC protein [Polyodon spathula]
MLDPCENHHCPRGKVCNVNTENKPRCVCQDPNSCPSSIGKSDMVCGTDNKTYENSCHLFAAKCTFKDVSPGQRLHLDYTGACKYVAPCLDNELSQFSLLIRKWLKDVLVHLYEYDLKNPGLLTKKQKIIVKKIYNLQAQIKASVYGRQRCNFNYLMNIYPVHWQFGQLDRKPADGYLSHSELAPLRASIIPMGHCTSRFFKQCDTSRDKRVSLKEWCSCFGIKNGKEHFLSPKCIFIFM